MEKSGVRSSPCFLFFSSRRRHTRFDCDWSSDVCSSDLIVVRHQRAVLRHEQTRVTGPNRQCLQRQCIRVRNAHEFDDLFNRQVCYSIQNFRLHDQLRVREVNRDIRVRSANQPAKKEKGSTKCRQRNCNANQLHTSERNSIIGEQEEKWPQKGTKDTNTICDFCACLSLLFCRLLDACLASIL